MFDNVLVYILAGLAVGGLLAALDARRRIAMYRRRRYWQRKAREHRTPAWRLHVTRIEYVNDIDDAPETAQAWKYRKN